MKSWFVRLWGDEAAFGEALRGLKPLFIRGAIAAVALFGPELVNAGSAGYWGGKALLVLSFFVRAGDINDPLVKKLGQVTASNVEKLANAADVSIASIKNGVK